MDSDPYAAPDLPVSPSKSAEQISASRLFIRYAVVVVVQQCVLVPIMIRADDHISEDGSLLALNIGLCVSMFLTAVVTVLWGRSLQLRTVLIGGFAFSLLAWSILWAGMHFGDCISYQRLEWELLPTWLAGYLCVSCAMACLSKWFTADSVK